MALSSLLHRELTPAVQHLQSNQLVKDIIQAESLASIRNINENDIVEAVGLHEARAVARLLACKIINLVTSSIELTGEDSARFQQALVEAERLDIPLDWDEISNAYTASTAAAFIAATTLQELNAHYGALKYLEERHVPELLEIVKKTAHDSYVLLLDLNPDALGVTQLIPLLEALRTMHELQVPVERGEFVHVCLMMAELALSENPPQRPGDNPEGCQLWKAAEYLAQDYGEIRSQLMDLGKYYHMAEAEQHRYDRQEGGVSVTDIEFLEVLSENRKIKNHTAHVKVSKVKVRGQILACKCYSKVAPEFYEKFCKNEMEIMKKLSDIDCSLFLKCYEPIVTFDNGEYSIYMLMEYCNKRLSTVIEERKNEPISEFDLELASRLIEGVTLMHRHNVYHLDLKPDNIMITPGGVMKFIDFNISLIMVKEEDHTLLAPMGTLKGLSAYYAPPELQQLARSQGQDYRPSKADSFSLGMTLLEYLSRKSIAGLNAPERFPELIEAIEQLPDETMQLGLKLLLKPDVDDRGAVLDAQQYFKQQHTALLQTTLQS